MIPRTNRSVWWLAVGYFVAYAPYAALVKSLSAGLVPGAPRDPHPLLLLPSAIVGTAITLPVLVTLFGWWRHWSRPRSGAIVSGVGAAIIIATTTVAYSFQGISVLFTLLLLRGGVLLIAPSVDLALRRRIRWFSWAALAIIVASVVLMLVGMTDRHVTAGAIVNVVAYLVGYCLRLPSMTRCAKTSDKDATRRYFLEEMTVAIAVLVLAPLLLSLVGVSSIRRGVVLAVTGAVPAGFLIGVLYAVLYVFGTLIYLDRRENAFCVPMNRASSLLSGVAASLVLSHLGLPLPSRADFVSAGLMLFAMLLLTPFHHVLEWIVEGLTRRFGVGTASPSGGPVPVPVKIAPETVAPRIKPEEPLP